MLTPARCSRRKLQRLHDNNLSERELRRQVVGRKYAHSVIIVQADLIRGIERVDDLDERQGRLEPWAVSARGGSHRGVRVGAVARALLRGGTEERPRLRGELLLEELQFELERGRRDVAAGGGEGRGQGGEPLMETGELGVLQERHLAQALDVGLVLDLHHGTVMAET